MKASETTIHSLLQGEKVFLVPSFQRRYTWRRDQWQELWDDLVLEMSVIRSDDPQQLEGHFLGSIVLHPASGAASTLMKHQVVDGQQRLTTILVVLAAIRDEAMARAEAWDWDIITARYMSNQFTPNFPTRLVPTRFDRDDFNSTTIEMDPTGAVGQAYEFFRKKFRSVPKGQSLEPYFRNLILHMILVEINTTPGDSVNTIFNTINSKGTPLSPTDLIRNELLLHAGDEKSEELHHRFWLPIEKALIDDRGSRGLDESKLLNFFWAREVLRQPDVTKKNLFPAFERDVRARLDKVRQADRAAVVESLFAEIHEDFIAFGEVIGRPVEEAAPIDGSVREQLGRLREWGADPYLPIALWTVRSLRDGRIRSDQAREVLTLVLSFLVRRALAGVPTNNLNRMLTPLASHVRESAADPVTVVRAALARRGSYWPNDAEVLSQIGSRPVYHAIKRHQVRFLLRMYERVLEPMEQVAPAQVEIEHLLPQTLDADWRRYLRDNGSSDEVVEPLVHTIGNLTLTAYNEHLSNDLFDEKRALLRESAYRMNRDIASKSHWTHEDILDRSVEIAEALCAVLPGPVDLEVTVIDRHEILSEELEETVQSMEVGRWTTAGALAELLGKSEVEVVALALELPDSLLRLIRAEDFGLPHWLPAERVERLRDQSTEDLIAGQRLHAEGLVAARGVRGETEAPDVGA